MSEPHVPALLVILAALVVPPWSPRAHLRTFAMGAGFVYLVASYLWWRVNDTVLSTTGIGPGTLFVWAVFLAECWLWYETFVLCLILLRRTDRSAEADIHEARLRAMRPADMPDVDVFIATYNEPLDVLEKTIAGAMALDWPAERLHVHVLDDGRRDWLAAYCAERGLNHLTRAGNAHAKAGNINATVKRTRSPFILVLDADFVPQRKMLMRAMGFFDDPRVGIVQMPHHFFNSTPLQTNLDMRRTLPDEQRFFFDVIQPGRDGWDCAFCCGSNGIVRRAALESIGGAMPTESITEDMLLTMAMLRTGYITRYLSERLAIGRAPDTLDAYFLQRARWAQGAIQLLYTRRGPLGPGLTPLQRLLFNPSHWLSQSICQPIALATPAIFLLTGLPPLVNAAIDEILLYQVPAILAGFVFVHFLAPREFAPVASTVESVLQAFRLMPTVLMTLVKPHGHRFKVTPKGSDAGLSREDRFTLIVSFSLILATGIGLLLNAGFSTRFVAQTQLLPMVAFWSVFNMVVLLMVATAAIPRPNLRTEERFRLGEPCRLHLPDGSVTGADLIDMSVTGLLFEPDGDGRPFAIDDWIGVEIGEVGTLPCSVRRIVGEGESPTYGAAFALEPGRLRDGVIRKLFTEVADAPQIEAATPAGLTLLSRVFFGLGADLPPPPPAWTASPPDWLARLSGLDTPLVTAMTEAS